MKRENDHLLGLINQSLARFLYVLPNNGTMTALLVLAIGDSIPTSMLHALYFLLSTYDKGKSPPSHVKLVSLPSLPKLVESVSNSLTSDVPDVPDAPKMS